MELIASGNGAAPSLSACLVMRGAQNGLGWSQLPNCGIMTMPPSWGVGLRGLRSWGLTRLTEAVGMEAVVR